MHKSSALIFLFTLSISNCQFYYNYEENSPDEPQTESQNFDPSAYRYNPPSSVNQQFVESVRGDPAPDSDAGRRRTRIRVRSRNYQSEPNNNQPQQESPAAPAAKPEVDTRAIRQERRQERRRQRENNYVQPILPPTVYSPSVFENIGLGEAPRGIYIPQDSFLNVLRNPSQRIDSPRPISQPVALVPQTNNYVHPTVSIINRNPQSGFFVQPPNEEPQQPNFILPVIRPQVEYAIAPPSPPMNAVRNSNPPSVQARVVRTNRKPPTAQRVHLQQEYAAPPTVDIDSLRDHTDDITRENVMSEVQYATPQIRQISRPQIQRRVINSNQELIPAPRVYSPSIFEKVPLGEAPNGVYVPEDSLLNVLRNPSSGRSSSPIRYRQELPTRAAEQPTVYTAPSQFEPEVAEEVYEPPIPPPSPTRRSTQRSRQSQSSRRSQRQGQEQSQSVQPSSHRQNQQRYDVYEEFEGQRNPVEVRTQPQRRPAPNPAPASRPRPQTSTSERSQSTFKKANLAIAELPLDTDDDGIPGEAGVNYPTLHVVPKTAFSCSQQSHNGYYADLETSCQVVHLCQAGGVKNSFLCPNGTIWSQEKFSCQWWYKVNCSDAPKFYIKNDELYKVPEKKERKRN